MTKRVLIVVCLLLCATNVRAQEPYNLASPVGQLATLFTDLYGPNGLIVDSLASLPGETPHSAHFSSDFQADFSQFSTALVSQLVAVPLPSPASGFTYRFDPTLGVFERTTQSFAPILCERSETIGAGQVAFGFAFQRFTFDTIEGLDLDRVPAVFQHDSAELLGGREDVVTTMNAIQMDVNQFTTFLTLGVTDRLDIAVALPIVSNDLKVVSEATIQRLGTTNPLTHFYRLSDGEVGNRRLFTAVGRASGVGDLTVRFKTTLRTETAAGLAGGVDLRLPTGDEMDLLGSGAASFAPFVIWSASYATVSPHLNASYTWNGSSVLAGNPATGQSEDFPDSMAYSVGADVSVNSRVTLAFDLLGRYFIDSERLVFEEFHALDGRSVFPNIAFGTESFATHRGAVGLKANVINRLLIDVNLLFALDDNGLIDKVTPLIGLEYSF